jgi:chromosome segregation ATPase
MIRSGREETGAQPRRDDTPIHSLQQQIDELRRQLKENLARLQWFEETYKQNEGKVAQLQMSQDRLAQDIAQSLHVRQIDDGRTKAQLSELAVRVEAPDKQIRDLRALYGEMSESRKTDRDAASAMQRQIDELQRQIREQNAHIAKAGDAQKGVRELVAELQGTISEARQEVVHVADIQRVEEQRLRRQGVELQGLFEDLRQQFAELGARSQRVDDVRNHFTERVDALERRLEPLLSEIEKTQAEVERSRTLSTEQYMNAQTRLEEVRAQIENQLGEMRGVADQRTERYLSRFSALEERLGEIDQALGELPTRFEALERKDEVIGAEADGIEEWLVMRQIAAMEGLLDEVRKRRTERAPQLNPGSTRNIRPQSEAPTPGSVYNPSGLIKSVRDARPPQRAADDIGREEEE